MSLRGPVADVLASLLAKSERSRKLSLDDVGDAVGAMVITPQEIDALLAALEARGRTVTAPEGAGGKERLGLILRHARELRDSLGRAPSPQEIADRSGLDASEVRRALLLAQVMGR